MKVPHIIYSGNYEGKKFLITEYNDGLRLSKLLRALDKQHSIVVSKKYLREFGITLGKIHKLKVDGIITRERRFHKPLEDYECEFDIAWAIIVRPSQEFLKTDEERTSFLDGYMSQNNYSVESVRYCMIMIYQHFRKLGNAIADFDYVNFVEKEIYRLINIGITHLG
ncbi:hypothetical protein [Helicovermis profundi]|uniref:Protein kinase domain-containing protein n=1 Tax=Helicovermis profundi TaxID=3065157 RepID=A0AAU9E7X4_9FIRM|nr:hypothetical protein HLPR_01680 [Clostridia bacterium S502]